MIESLSSVLPIFIYILLIILLIVGIILGVKLIITVDKVNEVIDDVKKKVSTLDTFFNIVSGISNRVENLSSKVADFFISIFNKVSNLKKRKDEFEDYE